MMKKKMTLYVIIRTPTIVSIRYVMMKLSFFFWKIVWNLANNNSCGDWSPFLFFSFALKEKHRFCVITIQLWCGGSMLCKKLKGKSFHSHVSHCRCWHFKSNQILSKKIKQSGLFIFHIFDYFVDSHCDCHCLNQILLLLLLFI